MNVSSKKRHCSDEIIDMELNCISCGKRLYVSNASIDSVLASLKRCGAAILICTCGQAQMVMQQIWQHQRWND
jgi:hypothetical protein